ncbi:MAG: rhodanese-related sulfurtransferase [Prochlorococcaceae cyanobacterium]
MSDGPWLVASFYRFRALEDLEERRRELLALGAETTLCGTILLAPEGINGTVCGPPAVVDRLLARLATLVTPEPLALRTARTANPAFGRLKVRLRREIVTMGDPAIRPYLGSAVGTAVAPTAWDELISDPDTLLIDTRNRYEVAAGSFGAAIDPDTSCFREFPRWVERHLQPLVAARRPRAIALFCTGGIRCEKASALLLQRGFAGVHQLEGGILHYLETVPEGRSSWRGRCFVFDGREAVDHQLRPCPADPSVVA